MNESHLTSNDTHCRPHSSSELRCNSYSPPPPAALPGLCINPEDKPPLPVPLSFLCGPPCSFFTFHCSNPGPHASYRAKTPGPAAHCHVPIEKKRYRSTSFSYKALGFSFNPTGPWMSVMARSTATWAVYCAPPVAVVVVRVITTSRCGRLVRGGFGMVERRTWVLRRI